VDNSNTFHYRDGQIVKKASMNVVCINKAILAIGCYEYNEKSQLSSIVVYEIDEK
jgi:hypothetical protein